MSTILKYLVYIFIPAMVLLAPVAGHASSHPTNSDPKSREKAAKENPDDLESKKLTNSGGNEKSKEEVSAEPVLEKPDSTIHYQDKNLNSLSKFNFVFYFIYKMKYNESPSGGEEQLEFPF